MGIYVSTLRAATKTVGDIEIARYGYAYKEGWECHSRCRNPRIRALHSLGDDAAYRNRNIRHVIDGEFTSAGEYDMPIFELERDPPSYITDAPPGKVVGYLVKRNGRFAVKPA